MSRGLCPKCQGELKHGVRGGLPSRTCPGCGGRWLDILQLESLSEKVPLADELLRVHAELASQALEAAGLSCPSCAESLLRGSYARIEVDVCRSCKGMFLDPHELEGVVDKATTRPCPKCKAPMRAEEISGVPTNACRGCGGRWLEVPMIEHLSVSSSEARHMRDALIRSFASLHDAETRATSIECPTCMNALEACDYQGVELDFCCHCRGLFVDSGEMEQVAAATGGPSRALSGLVAALGKLFR